MDMVERTTYTVSMHYNDVEKMVRKHVDDAYPGKLIDSINFEYDYDDSGQAQITGITIVMEKGRG